MKGSSRVLFIAYRHQTISVGAKAFKRKRSQVWDNAERNDLIARTAENFAADARKTLRRCGATVDGVRFPAYGVRPRVVVLAETSYHARRLGTRLPRWEVRDAPPVVADYPWWDVDADPDEALPPGRIVTLMHAVRYGIACDVLVRATAGTGALNWNIIRSGSHREGTRPMLVVDFSDESGGRERADPDVRRREYREQGLVAVKRKPKLQEKNT